MAGDISGGNVPRRRNSPLESYVLQLLRDAERRARRLSQQATERSPTRDAFHGSAAAARQSRAVPAPAGERRFQGRASAETQAGRTDAAARRD